MGEPRGILGVDPGLNGALVLLSEQGEVLQKHVMPLVGDELDLVTLNVLMAELSVKTRMAFLEEVGAHPGQGVSSMFTFGQVYGAIRCALAGARIPYRLVRPSVWTKAIGCQAPKDTPKEQRKKEAKVRTKQAAIQRFPGVSFLATDRSRVPHDGLVDAALIALYGLETMFKGGGQ